MGPAVKDHFADATLIARSITCGRHVDHGMIALKVGPDEVRK
jgi:hypothetical protein